MPTSTTVRWAFCERASVAVAEMPAASARNTAAETDAGNGDSAASAFLRPGPSGKDEHRLRLSDGLQRFLQIRERDRPVLQKAERAGRLRERRELGVLRPTSPLPADVHVNVNTPAATGRRDDSPRKMRCAAACPSARGGGALLGGGGGGARPRSPPPRAADSCCCHSRSSSRRCASGISGVFASTLAAHSPSAASRARCAVSSASPTGPSAAAPPSACAALAPTTGAARRSSAIAWSSRLRSPSAPTPSASRSTSSSVSSAAPSTSSAANAAACSAIIGDVRSHATTCVGVHAAGPASPSGPPTSSSRRSTHCTSERSAPPLAAGWESSGDGVASHGAGRNFASRTRAARG